MSAIAAGDACSRSFDSRIFTFSPHVSGIAPLADLIAQSCFEMNLEKARWLELALAPEIWTELKADWRGTGHTRPTDREPISARGKESRR